MKDFVNWKVQFLQYKGLGFKYSFYFWLVLRFVLFPELLHRVRVFICNAAIIMIFFPVDFPK